MSGRATGFVGGCALLACCACAAAPRVAPAPEPAGASVVARLRVEEREPARPPLALRAHAPALVGEARGAAAASEAAPLRLDDVLRAVETHFPLLLAAMEEVSIASARALQARGGFDTRLAAKAKSEFEGDYESDRFEAVLEQPTPWWGTTFVGGYRYGEGDFAVYDGEARTNAGGEVRVGVNVPLLQGGRIDARRVALWQARLGEERAQPAVAQKRLEVTRKAAEAYWKWVSWGRKRAIARGLLALAEDRQEQVTLSVGEGQLPEIAIVDNKRLIVERRANLVRAERGLQEAAILLSLYLRDEAGEPRVPAPESLPEDFPAPRDPAGVVLADATRVALARRPEVRGIELELEALRLDRDLAANEVLPALDVGLFAAQDLGAAVSTPDDKSELEFEALVRLSLPLQMRRPIGKRRELEAKLAKLRREAQLVRDLVVTDVGDATSALERSFERVELARENVALAERLEQAEREQLAAGESDLLRVNLREQQSALAASALVDVLFEHFRALTDYRAVLGIPYDEVLELPPLPSAAR